MELQDNTRKKKKTEDNINLKGSEGESGEKLLRRDSGSLEGK